MRFVGRRTVRPRRSAGAWTRSSRIVRAHGQHSPHLVRPRLVNRFQVDRPSAVVLEPVWHGPHPVEAGQVIEQRVARRRRKHRVADRTAEQFEAPGVCFARTGHQHDPVGMCVRAATKVVRRDCATRCGSPSGSGWYLSASRELNGCNKSSGYPKPACVGFVRVRSSSGRPVARARRTARVRGLGSSDAGNRDDGSGDIVG